MVLQPDFKIKLLTTIEERKQLFKDHGIESLIIKPFTKDFASLSPEEYVKTVLVEELNVKHIIIGYDHRFGRRRSADIKDLKVFAKRYNFSVEEIPAQDIEDITVSSTKIRQALSLGKLETANTYLGYNYFITGKVIKGKGLGRTLEFPTANLEVDKTYKLIPKQGVYVIKSSIGNSDVFGMMNIGNNPTVGGKKESIEVHFFNFDESIYGEILRIELLHRLRNEIKFNSVEDLKMQLLDDQKKALDYLNSNND